MNDPRDITPAPVNFEMDVMQMQKALSEFLRAAGLPEAAEGEAPG